MSLRITTTKTDLQGRSTFAQIAGVEAVNYGYDVRGRITGITQGTGADLRSLTIGYGIDGLVQTVTDALTQQVVYQRDAAGRITQATRPGSRVVGFSFDANSNVTAITPPSRALHSFGLNAVDLEDTYTPPAAGFPLSRQYLNPNSAVWPHHRSIGSNISLKRMACLRAFYRSSPLHCRPLIFPPR